MTGTSDYLTAIRRRDVKTGKKLMNLKCVCVALCVQPVRAGRRWPRRHPSTVRVLPFPPVPSASIAAPRLQDSKLAPRVTTSHLPKDAPNILIILMDDVGFGLADTYGGPIHTPTLSRIANAGISYNAFHTTSICSPTRAALLTGRNHQRVGSGTIAERAVDWDGYTGVIPRTAATLPKVLGAYGYKSAAFGKWHNTPATETTAMGPFTLWPTGEGIGFDYFYGFLAGETSQWEPRLFENFNADRTAARSEVPPERRSRRQGDRVAARASRVRAGPAVPDVLGARCRPRASPHLQRVGRQIYRVSSTTAGTRCASARSNGRRNSAGFPADAQLTPRAESMAGWDSIPESRAAVSASVDGSVRRLRRARRRAGRPRHRRTRPARRPRQHARHLHLGRQRLECRRSERQHQRAARAESDSEHGRAADRGH